MDQTLPRRRTTRLKGFDYTSNSGYVVTICTHHRRPLFGTIEDGQLHPSWLGKIVEREWHQTGEIRRGLLLDAFTLLPNHLHGILIFNLPDTIRADRQHTGQFVAPSATLSAIVRGFKSAVSAVVKKERPNIGPVWQRGFHDRIIRNVAELEKFRLYIANNVQKWELDRYFERFPGNHPP